MKMNSACAWFTLKIRAPAFECLCCEIIKALNQETDTTTTTNQFSLPDADDSSQ